MKKIWPFKVLLASASLGLFVSGCTPTIAQRGNYLEDFRVQQIKPGEQSRQDVLRTIGSPTTRAAFNENVWYYIGQETEKRGILDPEVTAERIFVAEFDQNGILQRFEQIDRERLNIPIARDKTKTYGNDLTFSQQLLGNIGKFNPPAE